MFHCWLLPDWIESPTLTHFNEMTSTIFAVREKHQLMDSYSTLVIITDDIRNNKKGNNKINNKSVNCFRFFNCHESKWGQIEANILVKHNKEELNFLKPVYSSFILYLIVYKRKFCATPTVKILPETFLCIHSFWI